jgi:hypothetical protein
LPNHIFVDRTITRTPVEKQLCAQRLACGQPQRIASCQPQTKKVVVKKFLAISAAAAMRPNHEIVL